jgi:hypothetical protein
MFNTHRLYNPRGPASGSSTNVFTRAHESRLHQSAPDRRSFPAVHHVPVEPTKLAGWRVAHGILASIVGTSQPRISAELPRIIFAEVPLQEVFRCVTSSSPVAKHTAVLIQWHDLPARVSI